MESLAERTTRQLHAKGILATMESAVVRPGDAQLFTIDNYDILYYGTQMYPGYTALSYYVHADTIDGGPISFTLRIKHYDV